MSQLYVLQDPETGLYVHTSVIHLLMNQKDATPLENEATRLGYIPRRPMTWDSDINNAMTLDTWGLSYPWKDLFPQCVLIPVTLGVTPND